MNIHGILKENWGYDTFRPQQEAIIQSVVEGLDTLAILPTGGGKSICYQIPGIALGGLCIVVSPLIALMKDQAIGLSKRGIACQVIHSQMTKREVVDVYEKLNQGEYRFLFVSPERLLSEDFLDFVNDWNVRLLAVDEAHCISQWGYDFRPPYLQIANFRKKIGKVPCIALTASATPFVKQDIVEKLNFDTRHQVFFSTFERKNISFSFFEVENKINKSIDILEKVSGSGLVYCKSRKRTKEIADLLCARGIEADYYHAGLEAQLRNEKQDAWLQNQKRIMVCTNAFGMGIDKPDVRVVIHYDLPETPEAFYQEAGRAGRDGNVSYAVTLYRQKDIEELKDSVQYKFPNEMLLRNIYDEIMRYLNIPYGDGQDQFYDFELRDFVNQSEINPIAVVSTLKLLELQEFWHLSESILLPSRVKVIATKDHIVQLEKQLPELDYTLKTLLRMYGGITNHLTPIHEFQIAAKQGDSKQYVEESLLKLERLNYIEYYPYKDKPQLFMKHNRIQPNLLDIDLQLINSLRDRFIERIQFMTEMVNQQSVCRSKYLIHYFGESLDHECEKCDICLSRKKLDFKHDYEAIKNTILHELSLVSSMSIEAMSKKFSTLRQDNVMKTIRFLLEDKQILLNDVGHIKVNK